MCNSSTNRSHSRGRSRRRRSRRRDHSSRESSSHSRGRRHDHSSEKHRNKSQTEGGVTVESVSYVNGKRVRNKKLPCFICKVAVLWLSRHLERNHGDNYLVADVMAKSGAERKKRLKNT